MRLPAFLKRIDWFFFGPIIVLLFFSLAEIYSISLGQANGALLLEKQVVFVIAGVAIFFLLASLDYHHLYSYYNYLYIVAVVVLIAVLIFGQTINGTRGWFGFFGLGLQPVELVKVILLVCLARYFSKASVAAKPLTHFLVSGSGTFLLILLILFQPDFGSAALLFALWLILVVTVEFEKKYLIAIGLVLCVGFIGAWSFVFKDYQRERLLTYVKPSASSSDYNVKQAIIAVGAGGLYGRGLGFGSQSQLKFLPEASTDFIFAVVAEELGLIGVLVVLGCFGLIFYRLLTALPHVRNYFGSLFLVGGTGLIFIQMFINIGMNMGILPVVGIPLPFVSYGGSALIANLALAGIMQSIISRSAVKR